MLCVVVFFRNLFIYIWNILFFFQQRQASEVLNVLRDHPDAWTKVDSILEYSKCQETKYFALQILEKTIKTRWKALPKEQCEGWENFFFFSSHKKKKDLLNIYFFSSSY